MGHPISPISPKGAIRLQRPTRTPYADAPNAKRQTPNAERRTPNAERQTLNPLKPNLRPIDLSSTLDKELFQISCIKAPILFRIHP